MILFSLLRISAHNIHAIESREIQPVGASHPVQVDIRIISATNQNLDQYIAEGKFREDLYYRLNVIPLRLPPLRERQDDIELLIHYFLHLHTGRLNLVYPSPFYWINNQCYSLDYGEKTGLLRSLVHYGKRLAKMRLPGVVTPYEIHPE